MELYVIARVWSWISYSLTYKYIVDSIIIHFPFTLLPDLMIILVWLFHLERPLSLPRPFYPTPASVASSGLCFVRADCFALISSCGWVGRCRTWQVDVEAYCTILSSFSILLQKNEIAQIWCIRTCTWTIFSIIQCCQPPIFSPDICAKSESNPKCLRKSLHQTNPKRRVIAMKPVLWQRHVLVRSEL